AEALAAAAGDDDRPHLFGGRSADVTHEVTVVPSPLMAQDHASVRDVLAGTDFFADADDATLDMLAEAGSERHLVRGDALFAEGDPPDALYVVMNGRIAIAIANPIDRRESVVALMEAGDLFGEMG